MKMLLLVALLLAGCASPGTDAEREQSLRDFSQTCIHYWQSVPCPRKF